MDQSNQTIPGSALQPDNVSAEILELLPDIKLFPNEDQATYDGLKQAFMADLAPGTPYETSLVMNLITLEWEATRHRNLRDNLIQAAYRDQAMGVFHDGKVGSVDSWDLTTEIEDAAFALVNPDPAIRIPAEEQLAEYQITPSEILAKAYQSVAKSVETHERKLADIEVRRRRLRGDFDRLKKARGTAIEDAEVIEEA